MTLYRHFALNVATAAVIWAWGVSCGQLLAEILPRLPKVGEA